MTISAEKLVKSYINIRNKRSQILAAFEAEDGELKAQQELIKDKLLELIKEVGADSLNTTYGTASRAVTTRYWTSDWGSMYDFIKTHDAFHLMEQRLHQSNTKKFMDDNPELLPPGLNTDSKYTIKIRKR